MDWGWDCFDFNQDFSYRRPLKDSGIFWTTEKLKASVLRCLTRDRQYSLMSVQNCLMFFHSVCVHSGSGCWLFWDASATKNDKLQKYGTSRDAYANGRLAFDFYIAFYVIRRGCSRSRFSGGFLTPKPASWRCNRAFALACSNHYIFVSWHNEVRGVQGDLDTESVRWALDSITIKDVYLCVEFQTASVKSS